MNACNFFVGKPDRKRPLERPRCKGVDNIKMHFREIGQGGVDWVDLAQDKDQWRALVKKVMNLRTPLNAGKFLSSCTTGGLSRRAQLLGVRYTDRQISKCVLHLDKKNIHN
jgi:hypothetical protein